MAKRKRSSKRSQSRHRSSSSSQFDKRNRLNVPNPNRRKTVRTHVPLVGALASMIGSMASGLDSRIVFRLSIIVAGMMFADDRRVAAAWFAAAGVQDDWGRFYDCLISFGKNSRSMALPVLIAVVRKFDSGSDGYATLACDDTPTKRYGKHVEGAGGHYNPTPGPADGEWMYGHNWVSLCFLATHPLSIQDRRPQRPQFLRPTNLRERLSIHKTSFHFGPIILAQYCSPRKLRVEF